MQDVNLYYLEIFLFLNSTFNILIKVIRHIFQLRSLNIHNEINNKPLRLHS